MENDRAVAFILDAAYFAAEKHRGQRRKDAEASPYINHPLAVAQTLVGIGQVHEPEVLAAALLHDTIEDTETDFEELAERFGSRVAEVVAEVSDDKSLPKSKRKQQQIEHAAHKTRDAKLVKLADKISNLRDIIASPPAAWSRKRKLEYFAWATKVVDQMRGTNTALEQEFDRLCQLGLQTFEQEPS